MRLAALLAGCLAALSLAACGGGSSPSTTSQAVGEVPTTHSGSLPGHPQASSKSSTHSPHPQASRHYGGLTRAGAAAAERRSAARQAARHRALAKRAGRAAPFLVPVGDNSIPTYGSESSEGQREAAEATLRAYLDARAAGEWGAACAQMAAAVQKQLALLGGEQGAGCPAAYAKLAERIPASARASVFNGSLTAFRFKEDKAFALFYGPKRRQYMMPMVSEGGAWKVNQTEAVPWPLGSAAATP